MEEKDNSVILTPKQRAFCEEYIISGNATQAALKAGYSEKTAYSIGSENLTKPEIKAYIEQATKKISGKRIACAEEVLGYLTSVMRGETSSEVVVVANDADGLLVPKKVQKTPDEKERLKAAELLGKRLNLWTGEGKERNSNGIMDAIAALLRDQKGAE